MPYAHSSSSSSWFTAAFSKVNLGLPMVSTMVLMKATIFLLVSWASSMPLRRMSSGTSLASVSIMTTFSAVEAMVQNILASARWA